MSVQILHGDALELLPTLSGLDACVCDPPYHLTSIVKRFGSLTAAPAQFGTDGAFARASRGFMGKQWDGGDIALRPETWALVLQALKPGAHLLAFGGTRTFHRMACAIEDAGFEIRDTIMWVYGSGFPKSHDVSKGIDRHGGGLIAWFGPWFRQWREQRGIAQKQVAALFPSKSGSLTGCVANWELGLNMPTPEQFNTIRDAFGLPFDSIQEAERDIVGHNDRSAGWYASGDGHNVTAPATAASRQWSGWGTALKPAWEPIIVARRPLVGTVAQNVLTHGTGAINVDGCRVALEDGMQTDRLQRQQSNRVTWEGGEASGFKADHVQPLYDSKGRWPPNLCHDGSDEVLALFPQVASGSPGNSVRNSKAFSGIGDSGLDKPIPLTGFGDSGSAARFFYTSKADREDRAGSKHPTVKPLALMRWLVRLVTPPGGTVLDCFAGSGTTGEAARLEGFNAVLIEREAEYVADIRRRMGRASGDDAPLFAGVA